MMNIHMGVNRPSISHVKARNILYLKINKCQHFRKTPHKNQESFEVTYLLRMCFGPNR